MYTCMYVCINVCVYVCMCVYMSHGHTAVCLSVQEKHSAYRGTRECVGCMRCDEWKMDFTFTSTLNETLK